MEAPISVDQLIAQAEAYVAKPDGPKRGGITIGLSKLLHTDVSVVDKMDEGEFVKFAKLFKVPSFVEILRKYVQLDEEILKSQKAIVQELPDMQGHVDSIVKSLLQLQANSLIVKIRKTEEIGVIPPSVTGFLKLMEEKLTNVNNMFTTVHETTGEMKGGYSQSPYQNKYIKYKAKYLHNKYGTSY